MATEEGVVKFFDTKKGYGFIEREDGSDIFVHFTGIAGEGYKKLSQGERVKFEVGKGLTGTQAVNVEKIG